MVKSTMENKIKIISVILALLTIISGIYQYKKTSDENFKKAFWEKRYDLYTQAINHTSDIANSNSLKESEKSRKEFWKLYWGNMSLIEDSSTEQAMVKFGKFLSACESGVITQEKCFEDSSNNDNLGFTVYRSENLKRLSFELAHCARDSLKNTWDPVGIESLKENRCPYKKKRNKE